MRRISLRWLALFHRWVGVSVCLLIALWFASGAVMHFVPYPALSVAERLARSEPINLSAVLLPPRRALGQASGVESLRLVGITGRPVYLVQESGHPVIAIAADTGQRLQELSGEQAAQTAAAFQGARVASVEGPMFNDQWTVAQDFDPFRPLYRVRMDDSPSSELYVSARSGEVLQRTTGRQRLWNWFGANIHWLYFRALRANWNAWDRLVWALALVTLATSIAGLWLGVVRLVALRRATRRGLTPFRGWLGWHHRLGLFAGLFVLTWIASGWLSMDHGRIFPTGVPTTQAISQLRGMSMQDIADEIPLTSVQALGSASEVLLTAVGGHVCLVARGTRQLTRVISAGSTSDMRGTTVPDTWFVAGLQAIWPTLPVTPLGAATPDDFYAMAEDTPPGARKFRVAEPNAIDVYVNPDSGQIICVLEAARRTYEWMYYALHTFKFPGLAQRPLLRHVVVLAPLALGFLFTVTGVIIAVTRVRASVDLGSARHNT